MSSDLEKKRTDASMVTRATTKDNGDMFEIRDKDVPSSEDDVLRAQQERKLLRKIDLW